MKFPARLHVLMASAAPLAVVFRRGPANAVASLLWNRDHDTFELGQWLRARFYVHRSDISPDGRHIIYFAHNGRWSSETKGSWTAISRAPRLTALSLYGKGDTWGGGGLFTSNSSFFLNGCHFELRAGAQIKPTEAPPTGPSLYHFRLQRDGWILRDAIVESRLHHCTIFERELPQGWLLRKYSYNSLPRKQGTGTQWDEDEIEHPRSAQRLSLPDWEWADRDRDSVVWAEAGCLHRASLNNAGLVAPKLLHDFNAMTFEAIE